MSDLSMFFEPKSIAVVGASTNPKKGGHNILKNIIKSWGKERLYPINPKADEVLGVKAYPSLLDVPEEQIDLVIIYINAKYVLDILKQCEKKKVRGVLIESAGFAEVGGEGKKIQEEMERFAKRTGIRIWGGNCMGYIMDGLITTFLDIKEVPVGGLSLVGQSGYFSGAIYEYVVTERKLGIRKACSIGNKTDVDENDMLGDFLKDDKTEVIVLYLESFKDGRRFYELSKEVSKKKPVICLPGATSEAGKTAAASHTGAIAGSASFEILESILGKQAGVVLIRDFEEMFDLAEGFLRLPLPKGNNLGIITITGAGGVVASDLAYQYGLKVPSLPSEVEEKLKTVYPSWMPPKNPADSWPAFEQHGVIPVLKTELEAMLSNDAFDMLLIIMASIKVALDFNPEIIGEYIKKYNKPIVMWITGEKEVTEEWVDRLRKSGGVAYDGVETSIKVLRKMYDYYLYTQKKDLSLEEIS